jgi:hypothetical protein
MEVISVRAESTPCGVNKAATRAAEPPSKAVLRSGQHVRVVLDNRRKPLGVWSAKHRERFAAGATGDSSHTRKSVRGPAAVPPELPAFKPIHGGRRMTTPLAVRAQARFGAGIKVALCACKQLSGFSVRPNTSLNRTRYGMRCKPGVWGSNQLHTPGLQRTPPRAG